MKIKKTKIEITIDKDRTHIKINGDPTAAKLGIANAVQMMAKADGVPVTRILEQLYAIVIRNEAQDFIKTASKAVVEQDAKDADAGN